MLAAGGTIAGSADSRTNNGIVAEKPEGIGAGVHTAAKARWLLCLALARGASIEEIRAYFRA
ncbi:hypothetical protein [Achromobacter aloeverae]